MPVGSSPTVKRRRLAAELRRHREQLKLTIDEVADQLEWSSAKISRIENARVSVLPRDVKFLLGVYGVGEGDERDLLLSLSRESRQKGWWHQYGIAIPEWFSVYVGLEAEAAVLRNYESEFVPGLLQTEDYARAIHLASMPAAGEEIDHKIALRLGRQERLDRSDAPILSAVINEAVIRRTVGGRSVMQAQLEHLAKVSQYPTTDLQVLPFSAGAHPAMTSSFVVMEFPDPSDPDVVFVEHHAGAFYLESAADVQQYRLVFGQLQAQALPEDESLALIVRAADDLC